jgi:hypothetical protein
MARRTWEVKLEGIRHIIQLGHGVVSGKREIWVDDDLVESSQQLFDFGSLHAFTIDQHPCELGIVTNGVTFDYYLTTDGEFIESNEEIASGKQPGRLVRKRLEEATLWQNLQRIANLQRIRVPEALVLGQHRPIGRLSNYVIMLQHGYIVQTHQIVIVTLIRHAPLLDLKATKAKIQRDPAIERLLGKRRIRQGYLEVQELFTLISLPHHLQKQSTSQIESWLNEIIQALAAYVHPVPDDTCEWCESKPEEQLTLVNGIPLHLCSSCSSGVALKGEEAKNKCEAAPTRLLQGSLAGLGVAIVGSLLWMTSLMVIDWIITEASKGSFPTSVIELVPVLLILLLMIVSTVTLAGILRTIMYSFSALKEQNRYLTRIFSDSRNRTA